MIGPVRRRLLGLVLAGLVAAGAAPAPQDAPEISVRAVLEKQNARLGDTVRFTIEVTGVTAADGPEASAFGEDIAARFLGGHTSSFSSTYTVNGRLERRDEVKHLLEYRLRPLRAGTLTVPALEVRAQGRSFETPPTTLDVIGPRPSKTARLEMSVSPERPFVEQPVEFVLAMELRRARLGDEWYDQEPWFPRRPPQLTIPWFEELEEFQGPDTDHYLSSMRASGQESGVSINGLGTTGIFGDTRLLRFRLRRSAFTRDGEEWYRYEIRKTLLPLRAGRVDIPISTMASELVLSVKRRGNSLVSDETTEVFIAHDRVSLDVQPIPEAGRPPTYTHAVGRFKVKADVEPKRAKVGDPMTLSLRVKGSSPPERLSAPALADQPDLAERFAVSEAEAPEVQETWKVFFYRLRPRRPDVTEVPPLEFASFDPVEAGFVVARTDAIPVEVEPALSVSTSEIVHSGPGTPGASTPGEELSGGLLGNYGVEESLRDERYEPLSSPLTWALLIVPPLGLLAASLAAWRRRRRGADPARMRAERALVEARAGLPVVGRLLREGDEPAAAEALHRLLTEFVAARARRPAAGLTAADVSTLFGSRAVDTDASRGVVDALVACEGARFGGVPAATLADAVESADGWLASLESEALV